jgi:hypothetical protein
MAKYETLQAILQEAGMSHQVLAEKPYGTADGSNKAFTTQHKPLSDSNHDDAVTIADVFVLVNGVPATVSEVDAVHGVIELVTAPAADAEVLVDYRYSSWQLTELDKLRAEAQQWLDDQLKQAGDCAPYTAFDATSSEESAAVNPTVRAITRMYAAALLLTRDYGYNQDTELTSKDGFKKLELINGKGNEPGMIAKFIKAGGVCGQTGIDGDIDTDLGADSAGDLFGEFDGDLPRPNSDTDECGSDF